VAAALRAAVTSHAAGLWESHMTTIIMRMAKALSAVAAICGVATTQAAQPPQRPNILLVISDDVGIDASTGMYPGLVEEMTRRYGPSGLKHPQYQRINGRPASTPNLARFARQGVTFTNTWAQPFCSPTRANILTGLFAGKVNVINYADPLPQGHTSFVRRLKDEAGYSTGLFGKWHLAGIPGRGAGANYPGMKPKEAGFDIFKGNMHAALKLYWDYDYMEQDAATAADQWRSGAPPVRSLPGIAATNFSPVVQVADALEWIGAQERANPDKPWLAWVAFNLSHATAQQQPSAMAVPNADTLDAVSLAEMQACNGTFGTNSTGTCTGEALNRAMTNSLDTLFGKLLAGVDALDRNTIVIYIGDNGTPMYARPNLDMIDNLYITRTGRGKGTAYESGARVPLAVRGPGIGAARVSTEYVHAADLFPTILSMAGLAVPAKVSNADGSGMLALDGVSLVPILKEGAKSVRDPDQGYLLTESLNLMTNSTRQVAARNGTYKVICTERVEPAACQFFDLANDPLEEFPLRVPASCGAGLSTKDPAWHYCRLANFIRTESFFARGR
jgi:arylsulfatase A-like enzyme